MLETATTSDLWCPRPCNEKGKKDVKTGWRKGNRSACVLCRRSISNWIKSSSKMLLRLKMSREVSGSPKVSSLDMRASCGAPLRMPSAPAICTYTPLYAVEPAPDT